MAATVPDNAKVDEIDGMDFLLGDRLAHLIIAKKWSPITVAVVAYGFAMLSSLAISLLAGTLLPNQQGVRALLEDYFYFISETILVPIVWGYYVWICEAPKRVLIDLRDSGVLSLHENNTSDANRILSNHVQTRVAIFLGVVTGGLYFYQYNNDIPLWYNSAPVFLAARSLLVILPTAFAAFSLIGRAIVNTLVFKSTLRNVTVHPFHPDRAGGLHPLGRYAVKTTYIIALVGIVIALAEYAAYRDRTIATSYYFHLGIVLYIIVAPLSFFAPLGTARNAMLKAKDALLLQISKQFNRDFSVAYDELDSTAEKLKEYTDKVEQLQKLQTLTASFPVWPFDVETIRRFAISVSSPIIAIALSILTEVLESYFLK